MFCENCGMKNEDTAQFCEGCGALLAAEQPKSVQTYQASQGYAQNNGVALATKPEINQIPADYSYYPAAVQKTRKPMSLVQKFILILILLLAVAGMAFYFIGSTLFKPENTIKEYLNATFSYDWKKAYDYMDVVASEFTTKDMYVKIMADTVGETPKKEVLNMQIKHGSYGGTDKTVQSYTVTYMEKGSTMTDTVNINLVRQKSRNWLFFSNYKVVEDDLVISTYHVSVPSGAALFLYDKEVSKSKINKNADVAPGVDVYEIKNVFAGNYEIKVTTPYTKDYADTVSVNSDSWTEITNLKLSDKATDEITKISEEILKTIYASAIEGKSFDAVKGYFTGDAEQLSRIENTYDSILDKAKKEDGTGLKSVTFSNFGSDSFNTEMEQGITVSTTFHYKYTYTTISKGWFSDELEEYTPTGLSNGSISLEFVYENDHWAAQTLSVGLYY